MVYAPTGLLTVIAYVVEAIQWATQNKLKGDIALLTPAMINLACLSYRFDIRVVYGSVVVSQVIYHQRYDSLRGGGGRPQYRHQSKL